MNDESSASPVLWHDTAAMSWEASPSPTVWRKRLELQGPPEAGRVTSVVRYDANSQFSAHPHPDGEEILVLSGVFSDEHGDYPAGSYLLNPQGFSHAPHSRDGCELFVKLRQYAGCDRASVRIDTRAGRWLESDVSGVQSMPLYSDDVYRDVMQLLRFKAKSATMVFANTGGVELFVLNATVQCNGISLPEAAWARYSPGQTVKMSSHTGASVYLKTNHLETA